jgi:hypothetical protein
MTIQERMFAEIHAELDPKLEAMRIADAVWISPLARGADTVAETSRNKPTLSSKRWKKYDKRNQ